MATIATMVNDDLLDKLFTPSPQPTNHNQENDWKKYF
jgi:hypothetical protein